MAQILAFGDSITDGAYDIQGGWANRLHAYLFAEGMKGDVFNDEIHWLYNLGISGDLSVDLLERVESESIARKVSRRDKKSVFVFAVGTNDSCSKGKPDDYRSSEEIFAQNLTQLINFAQQHTDKILLVGLPPAIEEYTNPIFNLYWYTNKRLEKFDAVTRKVAADKKIPMVEIFAPMSKLPNLENYFIDGLHPNTDGHIWMYEQIKPELIKLLQS